MLKFLEHETEQVDMCCVQMSKKPNITLTYFLWYFCFIVLVMSSLKSVPSGQQSKEGPHTMK